MILYFDVLAIFIFAVLGAILSDNRKSDNALKILCLFWGSFTCCFGGGIIRDVLLTTMLVISSKSPLKPPFGFLDISSLAAAAGFGLYIYLYIFGKEKILERKKVQLFLTIFDAAGMGRFIVAGGERAALCFSDSPSLGSTIVIFVSAMLSSVGGGIITKLLRKKKVSAIFREKWKYYMTAFFFSIEYTAVRKQIESADDSVLLMAIESVITILAIEYRLVCRIASALAFQHEPKSFYYSLAISFSTSSVVIDNRVLLSRGARFKSIQTHNKGIHTISYAPSVTALRTDRLIAIGA